MNDDIGIKLKGESELRIKEYDKRTVPAFWTGFLGMILIATYIFTLKMYEPADNLIVTGGIMVYPLTFLITSLLCKHYGFKETRKSIYISSLLYVAFFIIVLIALLPTATDLTSSHQVVVQYLFGNKVATIGNTSIFYPIPGIFFGVLVSYIVSHLLYATIYNALHRYTVDYLSVGLSIFIAYIIDRIIFTTLLYTEGLMNGSNTFDYFIKCLTSEFILSIGLCLAVVVVYAIVEVIIKKVNRD